MTVEILILIEVVETAMSTNYQYNVKMMLFRAHNIHLVLERVDKFL